MTDKFQPPTTGPYSRRATLVHDALVPLLQKEFGKELRFTKRGGDQTLIFVWDLPHRVQVNISKSAGSADPSIWINREDPTGRTSPLGDWKNEQIQRNYQDQSYNLKAVMDKVISAVVYNRERATAHGDNVKAMVTELEGIPVSDGVEVSRDEKTGLYTLRHTIYVKDVKLEDAKGILEQVNQISEAAKQFKEVTEAVGDGKESSVQG